MNKSIAFIINLTTKYAHYFDEQYFREGLQDRELFFYYTEYKNHEIELAEEAIKQGAEMIIVGGGDGTVQNVFQKVYGTGVILGTLPFSLGSALARYLEIRRTNEDYLKMIQNGRTVEFDVMKIYNEAINHVYCLTFSGIGYTGQLVKRLTKKERESTFHFWRKLISYAKESKRVSANVKFSHKDRTISFFELMISNIDRHSGNVIISESAKANDGTLEVLIIPVKTSFIRFAIFCISRILKIKDSLLDEVDYYTTEAITITLEEDTEMQIGTQPYILNGKVMYELEKQSQHILAPAFFNH